MELVDYRYECTDALKFMQHMPDHSVKLIITSPPYNVGKEYETKARIEEYLENMKPIISEMYRILSDDG